MLPLFRNAECKYDDDLELGQYWSRPVTEGEAAELMAAVRAAMTSVEHTQAQTAILGDIPLGPRRLLGLLKPKDRVVAVLATDGHYLDLFWDHCTLGVHQGEGGLVMSLVADHATTLLKPATAFDEMLEGLAAR